ncbi:lysosome membrane protein 2-like isoform X2 [Symsagittifera roscoffensis]|uniref:lysosome membrane protein 2-like isoform X2 n=1 Tax=Symsagittifera roscoffensis TaxID=84072 RepID=UPI00307C5C0C
MYRVFHIYSYTNADEFMSGEDTKPIVTEIGNITYRVYQKKSGLNYSDNEAKVRYIQNISYVFDEEKSSTMENETITVPNFPLFANNSNDGSFTIDTGFDNGNTERAHILNWNGYQQLDFWAEESCNMINGTAGQYFPYDVPEHKRLYVFMPLMCRSVFFEKQQDEEIEGVKTTKFTLSPQVFQISFEDNVGFCPDGKREQCLGNGLIDVSNCYASAFGLDLNWKSMTPSLIISAPEFLYADNSTVQSVRGLQPNEKEHGTHLNINRKTGVLLTSAKRLQMNTELTSFAGVESMEHLPCNWTYIVPLFWAEQLFPVDLSVAKVVGDESHTIMAVEVLSYIVISFACLFFLLTIVAYIHRCYLFNQKSKDLARQMRTDGSYAESF